MNKGRRANQVGNNFLAKGVSGKSSSSILTSVATYTESATLHPRFKLIITIVNVIPQWRLLTYNSYVGYRWVVIVNRSSYNLRRQNSHGEGRSRMEKEEGG